METQKSKIVLRKTVLTCLEREDRHDASISHPNLNYNNETKTKTRDVRIQLTSCLRRVSNERDGSNGQRKSENQVG